jgi:hypothetical protein
MEFVLDLMILGMIIQRKCRQAYDNHINSMFGEDEATPNYKQFFNFIKSIKCERTNVATLKREGFLHPDTTTKANIQFASVFTEDDMDNLPDLGITPTPEMNKTSSPNMELMWLSYACLHLRWIIFFKSLYFFHWGELLLFWCFLSNLFFRLVSSFISLLIHGWLYLVDVSFVGI